MQCLSALVIDNDVESLTKCSNWLKWKLFGSWIAQFDPQVWLFGSWSAQFGSRSAQFGPHACSTPEVLSLGYLCVVWFMTCSVWFTCVFHSWSTQFGVPVLFGSQSALFWLMKCSIWPTCMSLGLIQCSIWLLRCSVWPTNVLFGSWSAQFGPPASCLEAAKE